MCDRDKVSFCFQCVLTGSTPGHLPCRNTVCVQTFVPRAHEHVYCAKNLHQSSIINAFFHGSKRLNAYMKLIAAIASSLLPAPRSALTMLSKNAGAARQVFIQTANQWLNRALKIISPMIRCAFVWRQAVPPPPSPHSQPHPQAVLPSALCTPLCHLSMNLRGIGIPGHTTPEHAKRAAPRKI